jgi:hypothetical protein
MSARNATNSADACRVAVHEHDHTTLLDVTVNRALAENHGLKAHYALKGSEDEQEHLLFNCTTDQLCLIARAF